MAPDIESETFVLYGARNTANILPVTLEHGDGLSSFTQFVGRCEASGSGTHNDGLVPGAAHSRNTQYERCMRFTANKVAGLFVRFVNTNRV